MGSNRLGLMRADYHSLPDKAIDALELHYDRWVGDDASIALYREAVYHSTRLWLTLTILLRTHSLLLILKSPILTTAFHANPFAELLHLLSSFLLFCHLQCSNFFLLHTYLFVCACS